MLQLAHISYILASHLQIDADPDLTYHFDAALDLQHCLQFKFIGAFFLLFIEQLLNILRKLDLYRYIIEHFYFWSR